MTPDFLQRSSLPLTQGKYLSLVRQDLPSHRAPRSHLKMAMPTKRAQVLLIILTQTHLPCAPE